MESHQSPYGTDEERRAQFTSDPSAVCTSETRSAAPTLTPDPCRALRVDIGPDGQIRLPQYILDAAGAGAAKHLLVRLDDDEIKLVTPEATTRKIRAWTRKFVPEGVSLVDELLCERRR